MTLFEAEALAAQLGPSEELIVDGDADCLTIVLRAGDSIVGLEGWRLGGNLPDLTTF